MMLETIPAWWVLLIAAGLLALLIYWDLQSRGSKWRVWRMLANVLIILALLGLYTKPYTETDPKEVKLALVTDSYESIDTDSLKRQGFTIIDSFDAYLALKQTQAISEFVVLGDGLEDWELKQVSHPFSYQPPKKSREGPLAVNGSELMTNTRSALTFRVAANDSMKLHLSGTGIANETKDLQAKDPLVSFTVNPSVAGNLTFELTGTRGADTLFQEVVPMEVKERSNFNTLILTNSPSFEIRFFKNLLKAEGYGVAERLQVSKEVFRESYSNLKNQSLRRLTKALLSEFKVLVLDKDSYDALSYTERTNVNDALKKGTLGIIWMDNASNAWLKTRAVSKQMVTLKAEQHAIELEREVSSTRYENRVDLQGQAVGHVHRVGLGKVLLPLLNTSYQLQLKGYGKLYSELWNALLQPIVGTVLKDSQAQIPDFPRADEPTTFTVQVDGEVQLYLDSMRLAIKEKWDQPDVFTAVGWPKRRGWNSLKIGEEELRFFVFGPTDWQAQKGEQKRQQTTAFVGAKESFEVKAITTKEPISPWIFFTLLILSFGFLWVEGRLG